MARIPASIRCTAVGLGLLLATSAAGAVLAPKKASDVRTVYGTAAASPACPGTGGWLLLDDVSNYDGTFTPFSIPAGSVFVVTSWEWVVLGATPSATVLAYLAVADGSGGFSVLAADVATADAGGAAKGQRTMPSGVTIKGGGPSLCYAFVGTIADQVVLAHGFLAKDN